jgi:hypothetical protein
MTTVLKVAQGDLGVQADFAEPAFEIFRDVSSLHRRLYSALSPLGVRLADIRPDRGAGSLADVHVALSLFGLTTSVRIRMDKIEINCADTRRVDQASIERAVVEVLQAVKNLVVGLQYRSYSLAVGVHGALGAGDVKEFLGRFAKVSQLDLGPSLGAGLVLYHGAEGDRLLSAVTLDLSAVVSGGLFLRAYAAWDGRRLEAASLPASASKYWTDVQTKLGLRLE